MESIQVTTENLINKAGEVEDKAGEYMARYEALLSDVDTLVTTDWKGDDANAFKTQIEGFREDFTKMKNLMEQYAEFLRDSAKQYDTTQGNTIDIIKSLQN